MNIDYPKDLVLRIKEKQAKGVGESLDCIRVLELLPQLARDPDIRQAVIKCLHEDSWFSVRLSAAKVLHSIGDPLGILHLTYNALGVHPLLNQSQRDGYQDLRLIAKQALFPRVAELTEQCVDLLMQDTSDHFDVLSALPSARIVPRVLPLLDAPGPVPMYAAYILALKGWEDGRKILEGLVTSQTHVELALIALSHIPDDRVLDFLRMYANPDHPIYKRYKNLALWLRPLSEQRLFLLECQDPFPVLRTMEKFFCRPFKTLFSGSDRDMAPVPDSAAVPMFIVGARWGRSDDGVPSVADFIVEFAEEKEREQCAERQREGFEALLEVEKRFFRTSLTGNEQGVQSLMLGLPLLVPEYYRFPITITLELEDYARATTDWILHPETYRVGSYAGPFVEYSGNPAT